MPMPILSLQQARLVNLAAQGLLTPPSAPATKEDMLSAIRQMGLLQIDTIHVVARSPYLVLFSRVGAYPIHWLDELVAERKIFEHWAHAACYIPTEDFQLIRRFVLDGDCVSYFGNWADENRNALDAVLETVRSNGPVRSSDFKSPKKSGGWWNRKIEKWALEYWFGHGEMLITRRENFQRVYDLSERVLPEWKGGDIPPVEEVYRQIILRTVRALGVARPAWIADYYRIKKILVTQIIKEMTIRGELQEILVEGWDEPALYVSDHQAWLTAASEDKLAASYTTLLSPFDPLIWDRARTRQLFNFDFTIQAYTPAEKRTHGYFPLPILHNGELVGRLDAKAHRKEGIFEIKTLFLETTTSLTDELATSIASAVETCAVWHQTSRVVLTNCTSPEFEPIFRRAITQLLTSKESLFIH